MNLPIPRHRDVPREPEADFDRLHRSLVSDLDRWPHFANDLIATLRDVVPLADITESDASLRARDRASRRRAGGHLLEVASGRLVVTGERRERQRVGLLRHRTRSTGRFRLVAGLPVDVDAEGVQAELDSGVLTVTIPKAEHARRRRIPIGTRAAEALGRRHHAGVRARVVGSVGAVGPAPPVGRDRCPPGGRRRAMPARSAVAPDLPARPLHLQPRWMLLVFLGGAVGALARFVISSVAVRGEQAFPWATFGTNVAGAFALGMLLEGLSGNGADVGARRAIRIGVGTGVLGAFTTYSALAGESALLVREGAPALAVGYAVGSALAGLVAAAAGMAAVAVVARRQHLHGGRDR